MKKSYLLLSLGLLFCVIFSSFILIKIFIPPQATLPTNSASETKESRIITIGNTNLQTEIADTPFEWTTGLGNRSFLDENDGMIFIFPESAQRSFWMKDTLIPLDIIWVNKNTVIGLNHMFPELGAPVDSLKRYYSPSESDVVIETNLNWTIKNNIKIGDTVSY